MGVSLLFVARNRGFTLRLPPFGLSSTPRVAQTRGELRVEDQRRDVEGHSIIRRHRAGAVKAPLRVINRQGGGVRDEGEDSI